MDVRRTIEGMADRYGAAAPPTPQDIAKLEDNYRDALEAQLDLLRAEVPPTHPDRREWYTKSQRADIDVDHHRDKLSRAMTTYEASRNRRG